MAHLNLNRAPACIIRKNRPSAIPVCNEPTRIVPKSVSAPALPVCDTPTQIVTRDDPSPLRTSAVPTRIRGK